MNCVVTCADFAGIWAAILVFDAVVFGLTVYRVLQVGKRWRGSLFTLMLKDGQSLLCSVYLRVMVLGS